VQIELLTSSIWITAKWLDVFGRNGRPPAGAAFAEFGALEANLAEAIVFDHGVDFVFSKWGLALSMLCGGDHRGHLLSRLPQPARAQLRHVCAGATTSFAPVANQSVWAVDKRIWECMTMAMPTVAGETGVSQLLVALLFAPHPLCPDVFDEHAQVMRPAKDGRFLI
jgi:hypothetical protein